MKIYTKKKNLQVKSSEVKFKLKLMNGYLTNYSYQIMHLDEKLMIYIQKK